MQHLQPNTTLQGGKYRIERVLGQGGFGITYLATTIDQGANVQPPKIAFKNVAIKELFIASNGQAINGRRGNQVTVTNISNQVTFERLKEKFKKEASRLAALRHQNLVRVYDSFEENCTVYYVMDYIKGESLREKLNREGVLQESLVMNYLNQLISALQVVHQQNIWHLDIKPENIMVDKQDKVYLVDFGASKHIENSGTLTTSSMLSYTPGYFPPEQSATTMRNIGAWTDIYALGATLYNLLTKQNPPTFDVIISEGKDAFWFPPRVSQQARDLIIWMMKVNRKDRPQSVLDIHRRQKQMQEENEKTTIEYRNQMNRVSPKKEWARNNEKNQNAQKKNVEQVQSGNTVSSSKLIGYIFIFFAVMLSVVCISEHGSENFAINEGKEMVCWIIAIIIFIVGFFLIKNSEG